MGNLSKALGGYTETAFGWVNNDAPNKQVEPAVSPEYLAIKKMFETGEVDGFKLNEITAGGSGDQHGYSITVWYDADEETNQIKYFGFKDASGCPIKRPFSSRKELDDIVWDFIVQHNLERFYSPYLMVEPETVRELNNARIRAGIPIIEYTIHPKKKTVTEYYEPRSNKTWVKSLFEWVEKDKMSDVIEKEKEEEKPFNPNSPFAILKGKI